MAAAVLKGEEEGLAVTVATDEDTEVAEGASVAEAADEGDEVAEGVIDCTMPGRPSAPLIRVKMPTMPPGFLLSVLGPGLLYTRQSNVLGPSVKPSVTANERRRRKSAMVTFFTPFK